MTATGLQAITDAVVRRAQRQGYVTPREVRAELTQAGLPESQWKEVLGLARESLHYRQGRYYYLEPVSPRLQQEQSQQELVASAVREVIRRYGEASAEQERRQQERIDFVQPVQVHTPDGKQLNLLSRDLSPTGMRLLATRSLLGQKLRVFVPGPGKGAATGLVVRILWTCAVGDELFENGGTFLELIPPQHA
ncbi:MAG: PilZ domain-containing protein [Gemmataceae bacterium]|nr:PilZ domain-containing protein [Gemmataceae bacterium]